jgi:hypothetical protein
MWCQCSVKYTHHTARQTLAWCQSQVGTAAGKELQKGQAADDAVVGAAFTRSGKTRNYLGIFSQCIAFSAHSTPLRLQIDQGLARCFEHAKHDEPVCEQAS